ncbi:hypothetical protein BCV70DRAFT_201471 [Testicularia cyperi]|uniref:NAD(+) diphosphatase n=1 Tax=Testicularia cyperi TaxID=1882483 RepID=A0A317XMW9_9BASI|nr:hypothetical protein BCV70DRAFT_201471 [Testicularia cyperi]
MSATSPLQLAGSFPSFTTVNFYAGSKLNRLSWLRTSTDFLNSTITSPSTRFVLMKHNNPLCHAKGDKEGLLATLSWDEVKEYVLEGVKLSGGNAADGKVFGPQSYGMSNAKGEAGEKEFTRATDGIGPNSLALVFLGIDESHLSETSLPGQLAQDPAQNTSSTTTEREAGAPPAGIPYFALSLTYKPPFAATDESGEKITPVTKLLEKLDAQEDKYDFVDLRASSKANSWPMEDAAIVAQAKSLLDWNERHQFCPGCSRQQYSLWAGYKRGCSSSLAIAKIDAHATADANASSNFTAPFLAGGATSFEEDTKGVCPSTQVLSNFHYPRTDPVIIMAIISPDGEKVLLGRQKKWPKGFYSCLAGFCEPGESFEEAVRREVLEEAGIKVNDVVYHSSQPWPYPTNLMAGFFGIASDTNPDSIRLDLDNELDDARWYSKAEILEVVNAKKNEHFTRAELEKLDKEHQTPESDADKAHREKINIRLPPQTAIARVLVSAWARGEAVLPTHVEQFQKTRM